MLIKYLEVPVFIAGLFALALMDPLNSGPDLCLLEFMGYPYCPGDGLGHSIAYFFRGELSSAFEANFMGPFAVGMLLFRIIYLSKQLINDIIHNKEEDDGKIN
jgi:hypothetical protein